MIAIWYLLVLAPFVAIPIIWWNYRRKYALRESMSGARWQKIVSAPGPGTAVPATTNVARNAPVPAPATAVSYARRARVLDPAETLVYRLLKGALPDFEIIPRVALVSVLEVAPGIANSERVQRAQAIARLSVDCLVCDKAMQPVAAIDLVAPAALTVANDSKTRYLGEAGIRYLRWSRNAIPGRQAVRNLVLGG